MGLEVQERLDPCELNVMLAYERVRELEELRMAMALRGLPGGLA